MRTLTDLESRLFETGQLPCDHCRERPATSCYEDDRGACCGECDIPAGRGWMWEMGFQREARNEAMGWE